MRCSTKLFLPVVVRGTAPVELHGLRNILA